MAVQPSIPPVAELDYSVEPINSKWTPQYVARAFGPGHEDTIEQLFTQASELVKEHNIRLEAFSGHRNPRNKVRLKRNDIAPVLASEFGGAIQIAGTPSFAVRLCRGVLRYQTNSAGSTKVREKLREIM